MREESPESRRKLRSGFTTGACATATSLAAANLLLNDLGSEAVSIQLPKGQLVEFKLERCERLNSNRAISSTIKDAGDDPDVTHLATIFAEVELRPEAGVRFHAAEGVGTVTRTGLSIAIGEAAINPVPRQMMREHLSRLADECGYSGGFEVHVGIVNGEKIALKTMNARLGITGGLSTGQPIVVKLAVKPTPTIDKPQKTIDKYTLENTDLAAITRRDPTIVARIWPVAENYTAMVILDHLFAHYGYQMLMEK